MKFKGLKISIILNPLYYLRTTLLQAQQFGAKTSPRVDLVVENTKHPDRQFFLF